MADKLNNDVVPTKKLVNFNFNSINEAMNLNYSLLVKTREDSARNYFKIVRVEKDVMEKCREALVESEMPVTDSNIRLLVRDYYRRNSDIKALPQEEMEAKLMEIRSIEASTPKYPLMSEFGTDPVVGREYGIPKVKKLSGFGVKYND